MANRSRSWIRPLLLGVTAFGRLSFAAGPPDDAVRAFRAHVRATETRLDAILQQKDSFLWADTAERRAKLRAAGVVCEPRVGKGDLTAPQGLIHHWVGAAFIPGATVERVLALVQNYDNHKNTYRPDVIDSKTLERRGNDFRVRLRLQKRLFGVSVVLDTEYEVHYAALKGADYRSRSYSTRIVEIANPGTRREREKSSGQDRGFLWRLNTYWLFREREGGVFVECEAVSLSRGIPGPGFLDAAGRSMIRGLPREFLSNTLKATRSLALNP